MPLCRVVIYASVNRVQHKSRRWPQQKGNGIRTTTRKKSTHTVHFVTKLWTRQLKFIYHNHIIMCDDTATRWVSIKFRICGRTYSPPWTRILRFCSIFSGNTTQLCSMQPNKGVYCRRHARRIITENQLHPLMKAVQTVIDEKQARIDELEQQIETMMMSKNKKRNKSLMV